MSTYYPCMYWSDGMCKKFSNDKVTSWCVEGPCGDQMPSNADKIRAMTDEELADVLREFATKPMQGSFLKWLQQSAEEGER